MNLKDRLIIAKQNELNTKYSANNNLNNISDIFTDAEEASNIIISCLKNNKNIIFLTDKSFKYDILIRYIQLLTKQEMINIIENFNDVSISSTSKINITDINDIQELVKVFQAIITGYKPFIINFNINNDKNIIEKLKTLIAVNYQTLSERHIETLLAESNTVFVSVNSNKILAINELLYNERLYLKEIYSDKKNHFIAYEQEETENEIETESETKVIPTSKIKNILEDDNFMIYKPEETAQSIKEDNQEEIQEGKDPSKINKYKLLREKARAKKNL